MTLSVEDALWNAILFTERKSHVGDAIRLGDSQVVGSDDHVIIVTDIDATVPLEGFSTIKLAKDYIKGAVDEGAFRQEIDHGPLQHHQLWDTILNMMRKELDWKAISEPFAIRPARLSKFSRIRTGGDYPLDMFHVRSLTFERNFIYWKAGPDVFGVIAPVLRGALAEEFSDQPEVLWD